MFWALLAFIGATTNAVYYVSIKKFLQTINPAALAGGGFLCSSLFLLSLSIYHGIPVIGSGFLFAVTGTSVINIVATILTFRALTSSDVSLAVPMIAFTPLFNIATAAVILRELPSAIGILGIAIIVAGSYVLNTSKEHTRITDPFRAMISHPGVVSMLMVAFLYSVAINFDKMVMLNSDVIFGSGVVFLLLGSFFSVVWILSRGGIHDMFFRVPSPAPLDFSSGKKIRDWRKLTPLFFIGAILSIESIVINLAYRDQIVPYVIAIKRMSLLLIVLYGAIVFHERDTFRRLAGASLMIAGAVLILLFP